VRCLTRAANIRMKAWPRSKLSGITLRERNESYARSKIAVVTGAGAGLVGYRLAMAKGGRPDCLNDSR